MRLLIKGISCFVAFSVIKEEELDLAGLIFITIMTFYFSFFSPATAHRAKLYLREMRLQAFMYKRGGEFGPSWACARAARARAESAPVAVGAALALATAATLCAYAAWRYLKVKKVQYDTME